MDVNPCLSKELHVMCKRFYINLLNMHMNSFKSDSDRLHLDMGSTEHLIFWCVYVSVDFKFASWIYSLFKFAWYVSVSVLGLGAIHSQLSIKRNKWIILLLNAPFFSEILKFSWLHTPFLSKMVHSWTNSNLVTQTDGELNPALVCTMYV